MKDKLVTTVWRIFIKSIFACEKSIQTVDVYKRQARYNGNVTEVEEWGKKKLAYEIQKMHEGFYYFIQFEADAQCPAEVERHVRIMDNVLRYLVVRKDA